MFCVWRTAIAVAVFISAQKLLDNKRKKTIDTILPVWWWMVKVGQEDWIEENRDLLASTMIYKY